MANVNGHCAVKQCQEIYISSFHFETAEKAAKLYEMANRMFMEDFFKEADHED